MGSTTTSDIQLKEYAKKKGLPLNSILMRYKMNELKNGFYILNFDDRNVNHKQNMRCQLLSYFYLL